jgi:hypothetical protein
VKNANFFGIGIADVAETLRGDLQGFIPFDFDEFVGTAFPNPFQRFG